MWNWKLHGDAVVVIAIWKVVEPAAATLETGGCVTTTVQLLKAFVVTGVPPVSVSAAVPTLAMIAPGPQRQWSSRPLR